MAYVAQTLGELLGLAFRMTGAQDPPRWRPSALLLVSGALHLGAAAALIARPRYWPWALGGFVANHIVLAGAGLWPRSQFLGPNLTHLPARSDLARGVAITIDDGPDPDITPQVLEQLDSQQARATFFCIGERVLQYPDLAQEILRRGHIIENHSQHHRHSFSLLGPQAMSAEISRGQESIFRVTGSSPLFFRAPAGLRNPFLDPVLTRLRAAARELDAAGLRYGERRCRCSIPPLGDAAARRRYLVAARRPCRTHPPRGCCDSGSAAATARHFAGPGPDDRHPALGIAMSSMKPLVLSRFTATSCIGSGAAATLASLLGQRSGLKPCDFETVTIDTHIGEVAGVDAQRLPENLKIFDCRNNRLAELALQQDGFLEAIEAAAAFWGRRGRVGVFIGTSTAGIMQTELAYRARDPVSGALPTAFEYGTTHNSFSVADYLRRRCTLQGPAVAVSSACASSAKVFGTARRMIEAGLIDAALVGGTDSLCLTTLYGFHSLQLSSPAPCRPFDVARDGISIGEAGAFALLEGVSDRVNSDSVLLYGVGESSDAYHMSAPHPEGLGAKRAMLAALESAALDAGDIDYINLHGTGTPSNDRSESQAVTSIFGPTTPCSSTKGATGHTLGAAGALEAVISALAIQNGLMPGGVQTVQVDPTLTAHYIKENRRASVKRVLSNSFGFGGTNCSLIFGRAG